MRYSVAVSEAIHRVLTSHLLQHQSSTRDEDICFALWFPSRGCTRTTALIHSAILPGDGDRLVHGNAAFTPKYLERVIDWAIAAGAGIALLHSHPAPGWQAMSTDDIAAEKSIAGSAFAATGLPLIGLTLGTDEVWSARFWERESPGQFRRNWCESVRVVGEGLSVSYDATQMPTPRLRSSLARTISAWGPNKQANLARLHVGVIGCGSVGSIVAEALARMGLQRITLIDFDRVETVNLDRLLHATRMDAMLARRKVEVVRSALYRSATASEFRVTALPFSIVEDEGFRTALDCDLLFSCVDRPWPRSVLNFISFSHLIPVVDGGISARALPQLRGLHRADFKAHVSSPGRKCLECLGQYDPGDVSTERDGYLDDPKYIEGLTEDHPAKRNENVFGFSVLATGFELMQFLSMVISPLGMPNQGAESYHFVGAIHEAKLTGCNSNCPFPSLTATGDSSGLTLTGKHTVARQMRSGRERVRRIARTVLS
jgi:molybdopterin/thiamine biosynthesis adenylyltransferase